jgi:hypothetical protein
MCRSIKPLNNFAPPATEDEVREAALQYVRKISGGVRPAQVNEQVFNDAVAQIAATSKDLLERLVTKAPPKDRELEVAKAKARAQARYGS